MTDAPFPVRRLRILLVEDSEGDILFAKEAFRSRGEHVELEVARDGVAALARLRGGSAPDLVLLDLDLPGKTGHEVLREVKADPGLRGIPVVILSGSRRAEDIEQAYDAHANSYLTKPKGLAGLFALARSVEEYWGGHASLPGRPAKAP